MVVISDADSLPVVGVTLLSHSGHIIGATDNRGAVAIPSLADFPISFRSIGYEVTTIAEPKDSVILKSVAYELPEVSVSAAERPVKRVLCYAREYSTGTAGRDTMQLYSEYMLEAYLVEGKVKGYHSSDSALRYKNVRRFARIVASESVDTIFMPGDDDDITLLAWGSEFCRLPKGKVEVTDAIRDGAASDSISGKYGIADLLLNGEGRFTKVHDYLSDHKGHRWSPPLMKLFGLTMDISRFSASTCYQQNDRGVYDIYDMLFLSTNLDVLARGKMFRWIFKSKEPLKMSSYIELYPVDITSLTISEYKESRKDKTPEYFRYPDYALPEIPAAARLRANFCSSDE